jgi:hypothetical protein
MAHIRYKIGTKTCPHCYGTGINPDAVTEIPVGIYSVMTRPCFHDPNCCPICKGEQVIHIHKGNQ